MSSRHPHALLLLSLALAVPGTTRAQDAATPPPRPTLRLTPCQVPGIEREVRCGTYEVFENRAARTGKKISLKVVVVPASGSERLPDPFVFLHGGPGAAATEVAAGMAAQFAEINRDRDVFLMDQRGTGGSNPLDIDLYGPPDDLAAKLGEFVPARLACEGAKKLAATNDLTQYTTPIAMDDLDEVRAALGYEQLNVFGGSYGTRAAMAYLRQHPDRVRTMILAGVSRFDDHLPGDSPRNSQRALDGLVAECAADPACEAAFPDLAGDIRKALATLEKGPVKTEVLSPATGEPILPTVMHQAATGDWGALAEMALFGRLSIIGSSGHGMFLAVMCSEDVPFIDTLKAERDAAGTFMGATRLRQLKAACQCFPRGWLPEGYARPVRSDVPTLIFSGGLDPATPVANGDYVASFLPNARHVVVPKAGHDTEGMENAECVDRLIVQLVKSGTTKGLDTSCAATIKRRAFLTVPVATKVVTLPDSVLDQLVGRWVGVVQPIEVGLERAGARLKMGLPNGEQLLLAPVSPSRFKVVGPPGFYVVVRLEESRIAQLELEQGGATILTLKPKPTVEYRYQ